MRTHPGDLIYEKYMDHLPVEKQLAFLLQFKKFTFSLCMVIAGEAPITPELAKVLTARLGGTESSWLNLQRDFDWYAEKSINFKDALSAYAEGFRLQIGEVNERPIRYLLSKWLIDIENDEASILDLATCIAFIAYHTEENFNE
jgi:plasmid maintenance system antidote protein VapI